MKIIRKKGTKITALLLALLLGLFGLAGCGGPAGTGSSDEPVNSGSSADDPQNQTSEGQTFDVLLTFTNEKYIAEGDESLEKLISGVEASVTVTDVPEGSSALDEACFMALELLKTVPEGVEDAYTVVRDGIDISSVRVNGEGQAVVDICSIPPNGMSSYTEQFFIYQITGTLIDSFEEVTSVLFTVGGENTESIGGHMDTSAPYTMTEVEAFNAPASA